MIRRSFFFALFALLLSIGVHLMGLKFAVNMERASPPETTGDIVAVGNAFEDISEAIEDIVEPEPEQEQPVESVPPSEAAHAPETEGLVASENP
ncbi:hypothetical protein [uncultured Shimia sp.]|uniref:hypothetical protein n=1 Tax=uncultured Shimia sp. TaxID=573152 RepID=UPI00260F13CA|nr:hypothetical protein [uncultured Shimia sp.]